MSSIRPRPSVSGRSSLVSSASSSWNIASMPRSSAYRSVTAVDSGTALASRSTQMFLRSSTNGTTLTVLIGVAERLQPLVLRREVGGMRSR